ncbi:DNA replication and repair protein RecF [Clostridium aceticum]|uniref:DNA replication and repair protein RecF n=1 Tax=Clostridium aceticum TaxID=84022 RepID=A0A0D8IB12_9CLOT|nr:DNA replication/repair protein RecF [Clostridium aceticum]AKL93530.1 DNA replication and repair protein RecF [Clostridium aceticum]KJF26386.1 DNA replication protein RecF [Clostridium aceticum]
MMVEEIKLIDYRNYKQLQLQFHPKLNIFVGENAQGKTNILEALYLCAIGKSFRTSKDQELVKILKDHAYIKTTISKTTDKTEIEILINKESSKRIKINKLSLTKYGDLLGNLNVVLFSPEDLKIIKEGPSERRRFINNDISQILPRYYHTLTQYNKILQQRNKVLKNYKGKTLDLEVWDEQLIERGAWLIVYRKKFIKRIAILAKLMHKKITEGLELLEVQYDSNIKIKEEDELKDIKEKFKQALKEIKPLEEKRGLTLVGPHRDDLIFKINGLEVKTYGSQGQQRTTVLSLKLAELELMRGEVGEYPILLLDDVMSELDKKRQNYLIKNLKNVQTFITTTMMEPLNIKSQEEYKLFSVCNGEINRLSLK